jgi:signal transduction histidine kinase
MIAYFFCYNFSTRVHKIVTKNLTTLSLLAFLISSVCFGQNNRLLDSLKKELPSQISEKQFQVLLAIGFEYRNSLQDSTFYYCTRAFNLGKKIKIKSGLAKPLNFIGIAYTNMGNYKRALDYYYQSIEVSSQQNDSIELAHSYNNLGRAFLDLGDLTRAYENFILSKTIFERKNDNGGLAYLYRSLSDLYKLEKNSSEALEMSARALELRKLLGDNRTLASAYMELGLLYQSLGKFNFALEKLQKADSVASIVNDKVTKAEIKLGMAENLFLLNQIDSAFNKANQVLMVIKIGKNYKLFLRSKMLIAKYYLQKKYDLKALAILNDIDSDSLGSGLVSFQRDAAFLLMTYYKQKNDKHATEKYTNHYNFLNAKLENIDLKRQVDQLKFSVELEKKEKENKLLKSKQEQNNVLISKQRNENAFLLILAVLISLFAFVTWLYSTKRKRDNFKLEIQNQEIARQREEIEKQNKNLSSVNEELFELNHEKNTLMGIVAHDLKSPINRIFALTKILELEGGLNESQLNYLKLIRDTTLAGADLISGLLEITTIEESKAKPVIAPADFHELVKNKKEILSIMAESKEITIEWSQSAPATLNTDINYLDRIFDNLITNAIKFSPSKTTINVTTYTEGDFLVIRVKDQGPGFNETDKKSLYQKFKKLSARPTAGESSNGLGLVIVKTLINRLNGTIELISENGAGSEFIVRLPLVKVY